MIKYCLHCWPTKRTSHLSLHLDFYNESFFNFIFRPLTVLVTKVNNKFRDKVWGIFLELLAIFRLVSFSSEPDESKIHDRSLMFFQEAKKRGIDIKATYLPRRKKYSNDFKFKFGGRTYYYESVPLTMFASPIDFDDKFRVKKLFLKNGIPTPKGKRFFIASSAIQYAKKLGFPLVVKPNSGSLSAHVSVGIKNIEELKEAIKIAKIFQPVFVVEKHYEGKLYRATVIGRKHVLVCQRMTTNVVGDGNASIKELIERKNQQENRTGELRQDGTMAFAIDVEEIFAKELAKKDLNLNSIPKNGEVIYLTKKFTPQSGNDIIIETHKTHPKNKELFLKIANLLKTDIVGIDVIAEDISRPYFEQEFAIIETNSVPYTNVHQYPSQGKAEPVAEIVWDTVLEKLSK